MAAHFSRGDQWASPREAGDTIYTLVDADTMLRRHTTDHTLAVMLVATLFWEGEGIRGRAGVDIGSQSERTDSLREFEFYPEKHVK